MTIDRKLHIIGLIVTGIAIGCGLTFFVTTTLGGSFDPSLPSDFVVNLPYGLLFGFMLSLVVYPCMACGGQELFG